MKITDNGLRSGILNNEHKSQMHHLKVMLYRSSGKTEESNQECIEGRKKKGFQAI